MRRNNSIVPLLGGCVAVLLLSAVAVSCEDKIENAPRKDLIKVHPFLPEADTVSTIYLAAEGGENVLYLETDIDYSIEWQDGLSSPWLAVTEEGTDASTGFRVLSLKADKLSTSNNYSVRTGDLILSANDVSLIYSKIVRVSQGLTSRLSCNFSDWTYGTTDPADTSGETTIDGWSTTQKNYGFESTVIEGEDVAYCYGRNGYIKLGDSAGHGADIITPYNSSYGGDTELVVAFRAVAYTDPSTGERDDNILTVTALDGGVIEDFGNSRTTSIEFEVPYYDVSSSNYVNNMWNGTDFLVFIRSTSQLPLTTSTRIQLTAGSLSQEVAAVNNRIFIDNLRVYCRNSEEEEDLFSRNGGSGLDTVL